MLQFLRREFYNRRDCKEIDAASEESSETANVSENHMVDYNPYDELIEDIKRVLNEWETSLETITGAEGWCDVCKGWEEEI